jgi:hypothetical protein
MVLMASRAVILSTPSAYLDYPPMTPPFEASSASKVGVRVALEVIGTTTAATAKKPTNTNINFFNILSLFLSPWRAATTDKGKGRKKEKRKNGNVFAIDLVLIVEPPCWSRASTPPIGGCEMPRDHANCASEQLRRFASGSSSKKNL